MTIAPWLDNIFTVMAKRENRLKAIAHQERQLEMLKTLEPNATPESLRPASDMLIDMALVALNAVYMMEKGDAPPNSLLNRLYKRVQFLVDGLDESDEGV